MIKKGAVNFGGNIEFFGIIYNANLDNSTGTKLIETSGTSAIRGAALVDGRGGVWAGSSGNNIMYEPTAFANINAVGTAGVVQNTWREIVPSQLEPAAVPDSVPRRWSPRPRSSSAA